MLGQSKTVVPGRDRLRVRADRLLALQPGLRAAALRRAADLATTAMWNQLDYRPLEGLRLRGHAVQLHGHRRQPADRAGADGQHGGLEAGVDARCCRALLHHEAARGGGAAAGRHQLRARRRGARSRTSLLAHRDLAGVHFTGCTGGLQQHVEDDRRRTCRATARYPRIVGETGGKDFIVAHPSADPQALAVAIVRGGFEYQGQKCSAASRVYVPRSLWPDVRDRTVGDDRRDQDGRRRATSATSWAR